MTVTEEMVEVGSENPREPYQRLADFRMVSQPDFGVPQPILEKARMAELKIEVAFELGGINEDSVGREGIQPVGLIRIHTNPSKKQFQKRMTEGFRPCRQEAEVMVMGIPDKAGNALVKKRFEFINYTNHKIQHVLPRIPQAHSVAAADWA